MREDSGYRNRRGRDRRDDGESLRERWEARRSRRPGPAFGGQVIFGGLVVIVGLALLLDNLGIIGSSRDILRFWPVALVIVGLGDLVAARGAGRATRGTLLVAFGGLFLLDNLGFINFSVFTLWPLFLILFGVRMLTRSSDREAAGDAESVDDAEFDDFAVLGGVKRSIASSAFRGGAATSFMGGVDLDLRKARMEADRAVINVFAMMGGIVLRIPEDWAVESRVVALLGGIDDKSRPPEQRAGTLILQGTVVLGGVEIRD